VTTANVSAANAIRTPSFDPGLLPPRMLYLGGGMICYTLLALIGATSTAVFVLLAVVILSFYGGGFATVPAYLRDCSAASRWGRSTDGCTPPGRWRAWPALLTTVGVLAVGVPGEPGHPTGCRALPRTGTRGGPGGHRRSGKDLVMSIRARS
jgi:hypothetical protein